MADTLTKNRVENSEKTKVDSSWCLLLWNDDVNDMIDVIKALCSVCKLNYNDALNIMSEAHYNGQCFTQSGEKEEMETMQQGLNDRGISASVVKEDISVG